MKSWWKSKTLWTNIISIAAIILGSEYGVEVTPELGITVLAFINVILRALTKEEIVWKN